MANDNEENRSDPAPKMNFGFRNENINYRYGCRALEIPFTWCKGPRVYLDHLDAWNDGVSLTTAEKVQLLDSVIEFLRHHGDTPTVIVDRDDPSAGFWEQLCNARRDRIAGLEYTSRNQKHQVEEGMYRAALRAGKEIVVNGKRVRDERELLEALKNRGGLG